MHVSDLFPTLLSASGAKPKCVPVFDGKDQWEMINEGSKSPRCDLFTIDDLGGFGSYIHPPFKFLNGTSFGGKYDGWLSGPWDNNLAPNDQYDHAISVLASPTAKSIFLTQKDDHLTITKIFSITSQVSTKCQNPSASDVKCNPLVAPCLFNIVEDPCERNNLAVTQPRLFKKMSDKYFSLSKTVSPSRRVQVNDYGCDPANFGKNWQWWQADTAEM
jgi:arylsulfatase B